MADFVEVCSASDVPAGGAKCVTVKGKKIAVFNTPAGFYAIDNSCSHKGSPLCDGFLDGTVVMCAMHGWTFDVRTGESVSNPGAKQAAYPVKVEGGKVFVEV
jgi:nitrite reductase/ring-hydroxylating ferredoxin subunit